MTTISWHPDSFACDTPRGKAICLGVIDYGMGHDLLFICFLKETGESWQVPNKDVRLAENWSMGVRAYAEDCNSTDCDKEIAELKRQLAYARGHLSTPAMWPTAPDDDKAQLEAHCKMEACHQRKTASGLIGGGFIYGEDYADAINAASQQRMASEAASAQCAGMVGWNSAEANRQTIEDWNKIQDSKITPISLNIDNPIEDLDMPF